MLVKMINGTFGYREKTPEGYSMFVTCKSRVDPPFEVDDEVGNDLLSRGAAVLVDKTSAEAVSLPSVVEEDAGGSSTPPEAENDAQGDGEAAEGQLDPEQLLTMTNAQLKKLAEDMGLDASKCRNKAAYVALITAAAVELEPEDGEQPPDLNAEAPIV